MNPQSGAKLVDPAPVIEFQLDPSYNIKTVAALV